MSSRRQRLARATLVLVMLGATLGSALDAIHSHFGAVSYASPVWARAAWWVPLLFAGAYGTAIGRPLLAPEEPPLPTWKVALGMGLFIGAYWLTVVPWGWPVRFGGARRPGPVAHGGAVVERLPTFPSSDTYLRVYGPGGTQAAANDDSGALPTAAIAPVGARPAGGAAREAPPRAHA